MFGRSRRQRPRWDMHIVDNGNVGCPRRQADVDVDQCFVCTAFQDLVTEDEVPYLVCRGAQARVGAELPFRSTF